MLPYSRDTSVHSFKVVVASSPKAKGTKEKIKREKETAKKRKLAYLVSVR